MLKLMPLPAIALLIAAAPAPSASHSTASQTASDTASVAGGAADRPVKATAEKQICKQLPTSGSRLSNRACLTAKEWNQMEEDLSR